MKIKDLFPSLITEAIFAKPSIAFHGTSSKHLKSILSQGLIATRSGAGWGSLMKTTIDSPDDKAIGGVYFAESFDTALTAASYVTQAPDRRVVVVAQVQKRSAYVDEDNISFELEYPVTGLYTRRNKNEEVATLIRVMTRDTKLVDDYLKNVKDEYVNLIDRQADVDSFVFNYLFAYITRRVAYYTDTELMDALKTISSIHSNNINQVYNHIKKAVGTVQEGEMRFKQAMNRMTIALKRSIYERESDSPTTFRIDGSVGYRGNNKIVAILVDLGNKKWKVVYGYLPPEAKTSLGNNQIEY